MSVRRLFLVALSAMALVLGGAGTAQAAPGGNASKACKAANDFGQKHGGCVASATAGNLVPNIANFCRDPIVRAEAAELAGVDKVNHGQCVQIMKVFFGV